MFAGERLEGQINYQDVRMLSKAVSAADDDNNGPHERSCDNVQFDSCVLDVQRRRLDEELGCFTPWILNTTE